MALFKISKKGVSVKDVSLCRPFTEKSAKWMAVTNLKHEKSQCLTLHNVRVGIRSLETQTIKCNLF